MGHPDGVLLPRMKYFKHHLPDSLHQNSGECGGNAAGSYGLPISGLPQCVDNEVRHAEFVIKLWVKCDVLRCHGRFHDSLKSKTGFEKPIQIHR